MIAPIFTFYVDPVDKEVSWKGTSGKTPVSAAVRVSEMVNEFREGF